jgi:hypothetical protein
MPGDHDALQRALNEAKRKELQELYGAEFHGGGAGVPPEVERRWLREIEELERRFAGAPEIPVRTFIGDPPLRPLGSIPPEELAAELELLLKILRSNNIEVAFGHPVSPAEAYRFLAEEILEQEIADVRIEGLTLQFLYDEFHPDPADEAAVAADAFFHALAERNERLISGALSEEEEGSPGPDGESVPAERLRDLLLGLLGGIATFLNFDAEILHVSVSGPRASVTASLSWTALTADRLARISASGTAHLTLRQRSGGWEVIEAVLPPSL